MIDKSFMQVKFVYPLVVVIAYAIFISIFPAKLNDNLNTQADKRSQIEKRLVLEYWMFKKKHRADYKEEYKKLKLDSSNIKDTINYYISTGHYRYVVKHLNTDSVTFDNYQVRPTTFCHNVYKDDKRKAIIALDLEIEPILIEYSTNSEILRNLNDEIYEISKMALRWWAVFFFLSLPIMFIKKYNFACKFWIFTTYNFLTLILLKLW